MPKAASDGKEMPEHKARKAKRTRTGCLTCRARKVKCDESRPACQNCTRNLFSCHWPAVRPTRFRPQTVPKHGPVKDTDQASETPDESGSIASSSSPKPVKDSETDRTDINHVPNAVLHQHIQAFFTHIYPCQANGFVHRGTLLRDFQSGRINRKLLLALCAASSRFASDNTDFDLQPECPEAWAKEAKSLLLLEDMTVDTVATALILARHDINCGDYSSAWMLSSVATRAALALGLNKDDRENGQGRRSDSFSEQETRRRLFWACYCLDRMMSTGLPELVALRAEHIRVQLPCDEQQYLYGVPCRLPVVNLEVDMPSRTEGQVQFEGSLGLFAHYVQVMQIRYSVLKYVRNRSDSQKEPPPWDPTSTFAQCKYKLAAWKDSLSPPFLLVPDTVYIRQSQDQLSPLIMLHVWYEQCMSDLYRIVMPGFPETLPASELAGAPEGWVRQHQLACVQHATNIASIFDKIATLVDMENLVFLDTSLPMCVFDSMCVRLQGLSILQSETVDVAKRECQSGFKMLLRLVANMAKYFRQAKWLLKEAQRMLQRHGIHIDGMPGLDDVDLDAADTGSHPWQRRIGHLREMEARNADNPARPPDQYSRQAVSNPQRVADSARNNQNTQHVITSQPGHTTDQYPLYPQTVSQGMNSEFHEQGGMPHGIGLMTASFGWGEAPVIPELANFMGASGEWMAGGFEEEDTAERSFY